MDVAAVVSVIGAIISVIGTAVTVALHRKLKNRPIQIFPEPVAISTEEKMSSDYITTKDGHIIHLDRPLVFERDPFRSRLSPTVVSPGTDDDPAEWVYLTNGETKCWVSYPPKRTQDNAGQEQSEADTSAQDKS